ncbi:MAG TPA: hypothetical protein VFI73_00530 [Candidatus Nitrosopolaris sp.]|nr:hypothetical protein [Candidatus Nitrosopolaris sp.]
MIKLDQKNKRSLISNVGIFYRQINDHRETEFFQRYRNLILFNKNLVLSGIISFLAGALTTQVYALFDNNNFSNALITLLIGYCVYIPFFALLFYRDNKSRYIDPLTGKKSSKNIKKDIRKLFGTFSVSEIIFIATKLYIHYSLLQLSVKPYQALTLAELTAWGVFLVSINVGIKVVKLFK